MQSSVNTGFYTVSHKLFVLRGNYIWPKGEVSTLCVDISKQGAKKRIVDSGKDVLQEFDQLVLDPLHQRDFL